MSLLNLKVDCGRDRVRRCRLLTPYQDGPTRNCSLKQKPKFFKQDGKLDYSRYSQVLQLTLCYNWYTLSISFLYKKTTTRNEIARLGMGTIFLVMIIGERAKRARHSQVCSIENRGYI